MSTIVTRAGKGSPLTHDEVDANFTNLNTDKLQSGNTAAALTITTATINGGTITGITDLAIADGGTGASNASDARTNLGVTASGSDTTYAYRANNLSDLASASTARTNLGLGSIATQNSNSVTITGGSITGITDLAIADGGTGASDAAGARTNLGVTATGADTTYNYRANNLSDVADASTARTNLGLAIGTNVQAYNANTAFTNALQTFTTSQRGTVTTDNDGSFDMSVTNNFKCTPTATFALTFTNITAGQSGYVLLVNTGGYAVTAAATTKVNTSFLTLVSTAGTYLLSYFTDGTNVYVTTGGAMA